MTTPVGHSSSNPYSPVEPDTCSTTPTVSPPGTPRASEPLWSPSAPQDPAVAPLMDKYRPDVNALFAAWDTPGLTAWDSSDSAASDTTTSDTTTSSSATSSAPWDFGTTDTYSSDSYTSYDTTTSDASFMYATPASSTAVSGSSTYDPQTPPHQAGSATADLPNISAGTPPVSQRHHASGSDLVWVDKYGSLTDNRTPASSHRLTPEAAEAFRRLREYAERDGINVVKRLVIGSAFRNDSHQEALNAGDPQALANGFRAKAGNSTHRTGNALDVLIADGDGSKNTSSAARNELHQDPASQWLEANAGKFGFAVLGVIYNTDNTTTHQPFWEPWHITYNPVRGAQLPPSLPREMAP
jgi:LAS superfamily LD-carboxypeptidase LdcB